MQIYEQEVFDGIGDLIKSTASIKMDVPLQKYSPSKEHQETAKAAVAKAFSNPNQIDLYYLDCILASTVWNLNDDVFDKKECWVAKNTAVDKPFNFMHDQADIIGHITGSLAVTPQGDILPDDTEIDDLPDLYDIYVSSVIYRMFSDSDRKDQIEELIAEIEEGKWFVSMECLFPTFDYAVMDSAGNQKVIPRTAETAFLTKHLKAYKGTGKYKDYRIGRLLRNFTFSGKGLVSQPANPRSVIFNDAFVFNGTEASIQIFVEQTKGSEIMSDNNVNELQSKITKLEAELATANAKNEELVAKANEEFKQSYEDKISELETQIAEMKKQLGDKESTIAELTTNVEESSKTIAAKESELNTIKAEMVKTSRANKLTQAGVEADKIEDILVKWSQASEEMFDDVVNLHAEAKKAACEKMNKEDCAKSEEDKAKAEEKAEADKTPEEVVAEPVTEPALATAGESLSKDSEEVREVAVATIRNNIFKSTRASKKAVNK